MIEWRCLNLAAIAGSFGKSIPSMRANPSRESGDAVATSFYDRNGDNVSSIDLSTLNPKLPDVDVSLDQQAFTSVPMRQP